MKAFPSPYAVDEHGGMDLRDYFAARAMQGLLAHDDAVYGKGSNLSDELAANRAYRIADALMKARA